MSRRVLPIGLAASALVAVVAGPGKAQSPPSSARPGVLGPPPTKVCVEKYNDLNGNGVRNPGEPPLAGFKFLLIATNGNGSTHITDASGTACFTLPPGTYRVIETLTAGWVNTDPGTAALEKNVIATLGNTVRVRFGNRAAAPTQICVDKYNDLNGNGVRDPGEPPLAGFKFTIVATNGNSSSKTTDSTGSACFAVAPGTYRIVETLSAGWVNTDPGTAALEKNATVALGGTARVRFGNRPTPPTRICVDKYHDLNGNGVRDTGEPPLAGFKFLLIAANGNGSTHITDASGTACFTVFPGNYRVIETLTAGWVNTDPGTAALEKSVTVALGNTARVPFGNRQPPPTRICVDKYNDLNGNTWHNPGEPLLPGFTFTLFDSNNNPTTATTDSSGSACFTVPPGTYRVAETLPPGWISTNPAIAPLEKPVSVTLGNTVRVAFGNMSASSPSLDLYPGPSMPLGPAGHSSLERIFTVEIWTNYNLTIPAGSQLIVQGSISPNTLFGPYTPVNGWVCPVLAPTGFTCMTTTTVSATPAKLQLSTTALAPGPWGIVNLVASVSMVNNNDPDPSNDSISFPAVLH